MGSSGSFFSLALLAAGLFSQSVDAQECSYSPSFLATAWESGQHATQGSALQGFIDTMASDLGVTLRNAGTKPWRRLGQELSNAEVDFIFLATPYFLADLVNEQTVIYSDPIYMVDYVLLRRPGVDAIKNIGISYNTKGYPNFIQSIQSKLPDHADFEFVPFRRIMDFLLDDPANGFIFDRQQLDDAGSIRIGDIRWVSDGTPLFSHSVSMAFNTSSVCAERLEDVNAFIRRFRLNDKDFSNMMAARRLNLHLVTVQKLIDQRQGASE